MERETGGPKMYAVNHLPLIDIGKSTTGCCALIDPNEWNEQTFNFDNKMFVKAVTRSFLHIPINMSSVMKNMQAAIKKAGAEMDEFIILSYEASPWHAEHYFAVSKDVPDLEMTRLSGAYVAKVFEGPYKDANKWHRQLTDYAKSLGQKPLKTYFFYTTCPSCAKAYGKNYVIGFEQVEEGGVS
jgi:hypothetical protein